jgi:hypothetical protein
MVCEVRRCRSQNSFVYYGKYVCQHHFDLHCEGKFNLKKEFGIVEQRREVLVAPSLVGKKKEFLTNYLEAEQ